MQDRPFAATARVNGLRVREEPVDGEALAHLDAGQLVEIDGEPQTFGGVEWYHVRVGTNTWGWVSAGPVGDPYLELHRRHPRNLPAKVEGLAGGDGGYLAWGTSPRVSTDPAERFLVSSSDALSWHMGEALPEAAAEAAFLDAAFGSSGWLLSATNADGSAMAGLWRSSDGTAWEPLPLPLEPAMVPTSLIGHSGGYVLAVRDDRSGTSSAAVFTSTDGRSWSSLDLGVRSWSIELSPLDRGFVAWGNASGERPFVRLSLDGATWATDATARTIEGTVAGLVVRGARLFAVAIDDSGTLATWTADATTPMNWTRVTPAGAALADRSVDGLFAVDNRLVAITHRTDDGRAEMLASADGSTWDLLDVEGVDPDRWMSWWGGGIVSGRGGAVGVTSVATAAGANPRFVRSADGARWEAEAVPVLGQVDSAVTGDCPTAPTTGLEWMAIPWSIGAECFGSASISFDAYLTDAGGCGGFTPGRFEPDWLASPWATGRVILSLIEVDSAGCGSVALHPDAPPLPSTRQWVTVTGHWNDPASEDCRYLPDPSAPVAGDQRDMVAHCRAVFAATSVVPAPGS